MKKGVNKKTATPRTHASAYRYPIAFEEAEAERFEEAIFAWTGLARAAIEAGRPQIGVLQEKSLHSILKRFVTAD